MAENTDIPVPLTESALPAIAEQGVVQTPSYDRDGLVAGIVHFGVGGFHRAHQAMVIDRLLEQGLARDYAICGVGVLEQDRRMAEILAAQDHLYTLVLKHADGTREARVVGSIVDYLFAPDDPGSVVERLASREVKVVSLTITEGGYNFDPTTGEFLADQPEIARDAADLGAPATVFGYVVAALRLRREQGLPPFTVMSCDNIQGNGNVARRSFVSFAELVDPELAVWIDESVAFPNSMVDRITPAATDADRREVAERLGIIDEWPVVAEPWWLWVVEDEFVAGRPELDAAGVTLVDDVEPWEIMKLRLANVGHQTICYFGTLLGYTYAHEAASDPDIVALLEAYVEREAIPTLRIVPELGLDEFRAALLGRFRNPEIKDTLARLRAEGSDRISKWVVPVVRDNLAAGRDVSLAAAICASWARYSDGVGENGEEFTIADRLAGDLRELSVRQRDEPLAMLTNESLFGSLQHDPAFTDAYERTLRSLYERGARETLRSLPGG